MSELVGPGVEAAQQILNSGSIVVSVGAILVIILLFCMGAMYRYFTGEIKRLQAENVRLTQIVIEAQAEMLNTVHRWTDRIDALIKAGFGDEHH